MNDRHIHLLNIKPLSCFHNCGNRLGIWGSYQLYVTIVNEKINLKSTIEQILNEYKYARKLNLEKYFCYLLCAFCLKTGLATIEWARMGEQFQKRIYSSC